VPLLISLFFGFYFVISYSCVLSFFPIVLVPASCSGILIGPYTFVENPHDPPYNNASTCSWHSWTSWPMKLGVRGFPKMSVTSCWPMPCNIPQEGRPELLHGPCLKSFTVIKVHWKKTRLILFIINNQLLAHTVYVKLLVFNNSNKYKLNLLNNIKRRVHHCSLHVISCTLCCFPDISSGRE
jgi:hypothetical protein